MPFFKLFWAILVSSVLVICFSYQFCLQVIGGNKGGVVALVEGLKGFVPFSQVSSVSSRPCTKVSYIICFIA